MAPAPNSAPMGTKLLQVARTRPQRPSSAGRAAPCPGAVDGGAPPITLVLRGENRGPSRGTTWAGTASPELSPSACRGVAEGPQGKGSSLPR